MSIKDFLLEKIELKRDVVEIDGQSLEIRELTGAERTEMLKAGDNPETSESICYNAGVVDNAEKMDEHEFAQAFRFNYNHIHRVVIAICELSGYFDNPEDSEKN